VPRSHAVANVHGTLMWAHLKIKCQRRKEEAIRIQYRTPALVANGKVMDYSNCGLNEDAKMSDLSGKIICGMIGILSLIPITHTSIQIQGKYYHNDEQ
jgi:hypothetical protein